MLMNLKTLDWDDKMLQIFNIDRSMLPKICDSSQIYGYTDLLGVQIPICSICGDQQSALFGQMCFDKGQCKNTYGTGCFLLFNAGNEPIYSKYDLITSVGWKIKDEVVYVLEGSVFVAGAAIQWLRDGLKVIDNAAQTETIAKSLSDSAGVYVVPAFTGLGAPYWSQNSRGAIFGLTRGTTTNHIIRATLESLAYQSYDVIEAMQKDTNTKITSLQVDGGASNNDYLMQFQADILQTEIARPSNFETTALGAAMLAGLSSGLFKDKKDLLSKKEIDKVYQPQLDKNTVNDLIEGWKKAINSVLMF